MLRVDRRTITGCWRTQGSTWLGQTKWPGQRRARRGPVDPWTCALGLASLLACTAELGGADLDPDGVGSVSVATRVPATDLDPAPALAPVELEPTPTEPTPTATQFAGIERVEPLAPDEPRKRVRRPPKRKAPPLGVLAGSYARIRKFDAEFSPRPWKVERWDPGGFIELVDGEQVFLTVNSAREVVPQRKGHRDFGCLSGFIESVRRTLDPDIRLLEIEPCHAGPHSDECTPERTGLRVLERLHAHLDRVAPTQPIRVQPIFDGAPLLVIPPLPWIGLCSLGHDARAKDGLHYEHHVMIASRVHDDELLFFDVTAINGPNLRRIYEDRLRFYLAEWLARSATFDYQPATATLSCFAVLPPEDAAALD
jgi:hypothetical protein